MGVLEVHTHTYTVTYRRIDNYGIFCIFVSYICVHDVDSGIFRISLSHIIKFYTVEYDVTSKIDIIVYIINSFLSNPVVNL